MSRSGNHPGRVLTTVRDLFTQSRLNLQARVGDISFPLALFAVSRLGLLLVVYFSLIYFPINPAMAGAWRPFPGNILLDGWLRWDTGWFFHIATQGYSVEPLNEQGQTAIVFFPLYPLAVRALLPAVPDGYLAGLLVSNGSLLLALLVLNRLFSHLADPLIARRALVLITLFPFSFFFSAMYSESLFLLFIALTFYFGESGKWLPASLAAAAASATRIVGLFAIPALLLLYLERCGWNYRRVRLDILWLTLSFVGVAAFVAYQNLVFGDPLLFLTNQYVEGWIKTSGLDEALYVLGQLTPEAIARGHFPAMETVNLLLVPLCVGVYLLTARQLRPPYSLWTLAMLIFSAGGWQSMGRLLIVIFPWFLCAAILLRNRRLYYGVLFMFAMFLSLFAVLFAHWYWIA